MTMATLIRDGNEMVMVITMIPGCHDEFGDNHLDKNGPGDYSSDHGRNASGDTMFCRRRSDGLWK